MRRQSVSLNEEPSVALESYMKYIVIESVCPPTCQTKLVHAWFSCIDYRFIVASFFLYFLFYFAQRLNPSHVAVTEQHPSEKKGKKKTANASLLSFLLDSPFSSPFHSRRALSIIKGTCGTNPCKSPVLSVLYLRATQPSEILHLHA